MFHIYAALKTENLWFEKWVYENGKFTWNGLTLSWQKPLTLRNHIIDLQRKSMDWFLYDTDLCHERIKSFRSSFILVNPLNASVVLL